MTFETTNLSSRERITYSRHPDFVKISSKLLSEAANRNLKLIVDTINSKGVGDLPNSDPGKTVKFSREMSSVEPSPMKKSIKYINI